MINTSFAQRGKFFRRAACALLVLAVALSSAVPSAWASEAAPSATTSDVVTEANLDAATSATPDADTSVTTNATTSAATPPPIAAPSVFLPPVLKDGDIIPAGETYSMRHGFAITAGSEDLTYGVDFTYAPQANFPDQSPMLTVLSGKPLTLANADPTAATSHLIKVGVQEGDPFTADITLNGIAMRNSDGRGTSGLSLYPPASLTLTLADDTKNTIQGGQNAAGIHLVSSANFTINGGEKGTGSLLAEGGHNAPGIRLWSIKNFTVNGGNVVALGGASGYSGNTFGFQNSAGYTFTLNGGNVTAQGRCGALGVNDTGVLDSVVLNINGGIFNVQSNADVSMELRNESTYTLNGGVLLVKNPRIDATPTLTRGFLCSTDEQGRTTLDFYGDQTASALAASLAAADEYIRYALREYLVGNGDGVTVTADVATIGADISFTVDTSLTVDSRSAADPNAAAALSAAAYAHADSGLIVDGSLMVLKNGALLNRSHILVNGELNREDGSDVQCFDGARLTVMQGAIVHEIRTDRFLMHKGSTLAVEGGFLVTADEDILYGTDLVYGVSVLDGDAFPPEQLFLRQEKSITVANLDPETPTSHTIYLDDLREPVDAKVTLAGVNIESSTFNPIALRTYDTLAIRLAEGSVNKLTALGDGGYAALCVLSDAGVIIDGTGTLIAKGGAGAAAIGGDSGYAGGKIIINGGNITALGGEVLIDNGGDILVRGAGIGGGNENGAGDGSIDTVVDMARAAGIGGGNGATSHGTFATSGAGMGAGSAFIVANSIGDTSYKTARTTSGVILTPNKDGAAYDGKNGTGLLFGEHFTLGSDAAIPDGYTLTLKAGQSLTVAADATLTVAPKGNLIVEKPAEGTLESYQDTAITGTTFETIKPAPTPTPKPNKPSTGSTGGVTVTTPTVVATPVPAPDAPKSPATGETNVFAWIVAWFAALVG